MANNHQNIKASKTNKDVSIEASQFTGPIPYSGEIEKLEKFIPNAGERFMKLYEKQVAHRIEIEKRVINTQNRNSTLGVVFAFILGACSLVGGIWLSFAGATSSGITISVTGIGTLAGAFIYGTRSSNKELQDKRKK